MFEKDTVRFAAHFVRTYPGRTFLMVSLLILAGIAEGMGVVTLLPVLEVAVGTEEGQASGISLAVAEILQGVGLAPNLGVLLTVIVMAIIAKAVFTWLAMRQVGYTVAQVATDLRLQLIRALIKARWSHFTSHRTGHFATSISSEAQRAASAYREGCAVLASAIQVAVYMVIVFAVSWRLALITIAVGLAVSLLLRRFVAMVREAGRTETRLMKQLVWRLSDALPGIKPIKAMAREGQLLPLLEEETMEFNEARRRKVVATEGMKAFHEPILVLAIAVGIFAVLTWSNLPFSAVLVMVFLFHRVVTQINRIQSKYQEIASSESAFWSMHEHIARAMDDEEELGGSLPPPPLEDEIRFQGVSFAYGSEPVLQNVDLTIPAGRFVAMIGSSGAGKTTLVDLVAGLHRPTEGEVLLDGIPLGQVDLKAWRGRIGYVPQETLLFDGSVYRNVTLGDETVPRSEVQEALAAAGAWEFVSHLPDGMDRRIGERGTRLSGGQRQRIAIARALLRRPSILILDEATTALDPATEAAILETLGELRGQVTVLAISHQHAMREAADIVYEVANGRVERVVPAPGTEASITGVL
jgi:ATP-binding cassette, subfamily C, bacterial